jgi:hypothetical protein
MPRAGQRGDPDSGLVLVLVLVVVDVLGLLAVKKTPAVGGWSLEAEPFIS